MSRLDEVIGNVGYILDCLMTFRNIVQTGCCNDCRGGSTGCGYRRLSLARWSGITARSI